MSFSEKEQQQARNYLKSLDWPELTADADYETGRSRAFYFTVLERTDHHTNFRAVLVKQLDSYFNGTAAALLKSENSDSQNAWPHVHGVVVLPGTMQADEFRAMLLSWAIRYHKKQGIDATATIGTNDLVAVSGVYGLSDGTTCSGQLIRYMEKPTSDIPGYTGGHLRTIRWHLAPVRDL